MPWCYSAGLEGIAWPLAGHGLVPVSPWGTCNGAAHQARPHGAAFRHPAGTGGRAASPTLFLVQEVKAWQASCWKLGPPPCFFHVAACCHPCLRLTVFPICWEEPSVGYLLVNRARSCPFPAAPDHINKRLVPNRGIGWDGAFHRQRAPELHLRRLFVSVETTWTAGRAGSWKWASACSYLQPVDISTETCVWWGRLGSAASKARRALPGRVHGLCVAMLQVGEMAAISQASVREKQGRWLVLPLKSCWGLLRDCNATVSLLSVPQLGQEGPSVLVAQLRRAQGMVFSTHGP